MIPRFSPNYNIKNIFSLFMPANENSISCLENLFIQKTKHKNAIFFRYGRSGIYYLLKALGAKNKKVVLPSYSCVVVANAIEMSGNIPVFLDNEKNCFQPNPESYFNAIDKDTIMIIPTHLFGITQEFENEFKKIKMMYPNIFILQDCAHSFFCKDKKGNFVGKWGDGALFGMNISKLINSVKGGMLTLNDTKLSEEIRKIFNNESIEFNSTYDSINSRLYVFLATFAFIPLIYKFVYMLIKKTNFLKKYTEYYDKNKVTMPNDFSKKNLKFNAKVGIKSFYNYERRLSFRKKLAKIYCSELGNIKSIIIPSFNLGYTWSHFPIIVDIKKRNKIIKQLIEAGFEPGFILDYSIADINFFKNKYNFNLINSANTYKRMINLPITFYEVLSLNNHDKSVYRICKIIRDNS